MHDSPALLAEAQRQFLICSACRYCEGYCATFPAIERRTEFAPADVAYIANVCHDCRACAQACMYGAPHEFAVDIPRLLSEVRVQTYEELSIPGGLGKVFGHAAGRVTVGAAILAFGLLLAAIGASGRWNQLTRANDAPGAFYAVVPFLWMAVPALVLTALGVAAFAASARRLIHDADPGARGTLRDWLGAWWDGVTLVYMKGGGDGCYYPEQNAPSTLRRIFHATLVAGVTLAFLATLAAAFMQHFLEQLPPYPLLSAPVVLGTLGGIGMLAGAGGLPAMEARPAARERETARMVSLDVTFLVALLVLAVTGLALLAFRATALMGTLLVVHLAAVAAVFLTAPYGKVMHIPLRLAALLLFRIEESRERAGG